jgi:hypothetical protein
MIIESMPTALKATVAPTPFAKLTKRLYRVYPIRLLIEWEDFTVPIIF